MERKGHKRKNNHVVIVTTDAVDASVKQFKIRSWVTTLLMIVFCLAIGALIGYFCFIGEINQEQHQREAAQKEVIEALEQEKAQLEQEKTDLKMQVASLEETVQLLSETIKQKTQSEQELSDKIEKQLVPTGFPLNSSATMEEVTEGDPMYIFVGADDAMVVATAGGTVVAVNDDAEYGKNVWIDHGNGYVTIYRNAGEVKVKQGETVTLGSTIFLIGQSSNKLGYQMMKDGVYINPMEMLSISG